MEKVKDEKTKGFLIRFPSDLHKKLKMFCAEKRITTQHLFREYVKGLKVKD